MPATVTAGASFRAGLRSELLGTYRRMYEALRPRLEMAMGMDYPSDKRSEFYFYWESAPHISRWAYGDDVSFEGFKGVQMEVVNHRWGKAIKWDTDERADDQTQSLLEHARGLGQSAALVDERVFFQILGGSTDSQLLPSVPNAPDGSALHLPSTRFGFSGGNSFNGDAVSSDSTARSLFWTMISKYREFQDIQGQPLLDPSVVDGRKLLITEPTYEEYFQAAFNREIGADQAGGAGVSNEITATGHQVTVWVTQRCPDDEAHCFLGDCPTKAVFSQLREGIQENLANANTGSDEGFDQDREKIRFKLRKGFGVALPYATVEATAINA